MSKKVHEIRTETATRRNFARYDGGVRHTETSQQESEGTQCESALVIGRMGRPRLTDPQGLPGLARALAQRGWNPVQAAAAAGVGPCTVVRALRGCDVSLDALRKLRDALGVTADDLIGPPSEEANS